MTTELRAWLGRAALCAFSLSSWAYAADMKWADQQIQEYFNNPLIYSQNHKHVAKYDPETGNLLPSQSLFSEESIIDNNFVLDKDLAQNSFNKNKQKKESMGRAAFKANDLARDLVYDFKYSNITQMENLMNGQVEASPWSDDYWPIYRGVIAARYSDARFPGRNGEKDWYAITSWLSKTSSSLDDLSPAEKYDVIVGDSEMSLTNAMIREGAGYYYPRHSVETWMGICHGWAPGAMMVPRPANAITVKSPLGYSLNIYPSDIKAMISLLWAKGKYDQRFIGGRCNEKNPATDANGRVLSDNCFDTNPGTWHEVVVNQIGHKKSSFVLDATYDYEVWNQPAHSYEYIYFNPITRTTSRNWRDAVVQRNTFNDMYARYRSANGKYIVGVAMKFIYIAETAPTHNFPDNPRLDRKVAVNYLYDLELDANMNIIGGEWYHREHPDFLWTPTATAQALSIGDTHINRTHDSWNGSDTIPESWKEIAKLTSQRGQPLAAVVNALVARSHIGH